jgi:S-methylmethionine-dependent homocysteine/selenocysteine methylase
METTLQYKQGFELPHFCLFHLLNDDRAVDALRDYHRRVIDASIEYGFGTILEGLHYRGSRDWGELLGYSREGLAEINIRGIEFYKELANEYRGEKVPMPIGGVLGPRGDAYDIGRVPDASEAEDYHSEQIETFERAGADMVTAATLSFVDEAIGIARAAKSIGIPIVISFTLDKSGRLETGESLRDAVKAVDIATNSAPAYYMINCSHPADFEPALESGDWIQRLLGFMPNAATLDKGTLCQLGHLEEGDPVELGEQMGNLAKRYPHMTVWGGCCGTDSTHISEICRNVAAVRAAA